MKIPLAEDQPTASIAESAGWFSISKASMHRAVNEGRAPCDVIRIGRRTVVSVASARRALGLDPAPNGAPTTRE